ncbi:hypothetical protein [Lentzea terrae]|uniref:hypothetical protein n=1 Tax=Lentzea terrae TaxID=2200761 RepID=UPI0013005C01|nr:hypothetical protein [Lentzea terrae]
MAKAIKAELEGMSEVVARLNSLGLKLTDIPTMPVVAQRYAEVTASLAPKRSGFLAGKIKAVKSKKNQAAARSSAKYSAVINYGNPKRNIRAQHFMNRADDVLAQELIALINKGIDQLIAEQDLQP